MTRNFNLFVAVFLCVLGLASTAHARRLDPETGLMYYRQRVYSTGLGRYVSRWHSLELDVHLYQYQFAKPATLTDPFGDPDPKLGEDEPNPPPDPGAGEHGSERGWVNTPYQWSIGALIRLAKEAFRSWPDARDHLAHYLDNNGNEKTIRLLKMINDVPSAKTNFELEVSDFKDFVETLPEGTHNVTSGSAGSGYNRKNENENWFYAVGGYAYWGKGKATVECIKPDLYRYTLDLEYKFKDRYNWDTGKSVTIAGVTITDKFMGDLHRAGQAKEFPMKGSVMTQRVWYRRIGGNTPQGSGPYVPPPSGPVRPGVGPGTTRSPGR